MVLGSLIMADPGFQFSFPAPARIWSTNDERKMHYMEVRELIDAWKGATKLLYQSTCAARQVSRRQPPSIVRLTIPIKTKVRRDPHNYCGSVLKAVIDGMVKGGAWEDDTPEWVDHYQPVFEHEGLVKVELWPMPSSLLLKRN